MKSKNHFILMKRSGLSASGNAMSATESALALVNLGFWPLFKNTPCRKMISPGSHVLIYLAGTEKDCQHVIASACIASITQWNHREHQSKYPLILDGEPEQVLTFKDVIIFQSPISIRANFSKLDLIPKKNLSKWGSAMMGGMKAISVTDYNILSGVM